MFTALENAERAEVIVFYVENEIEWQEITSTEVGGSSSRNIPR